MEIPRRPFGLGARPMDGFTDAERLRAVIRGKARPEQMGIPVADGVRRQLMDAIDRANGKIPNDDED